MPVLSERKTEILNLDRLILVVSDCDEFPRVKLKHLNLLFRKRESIKDVRNSLIFLIQSTLLKILKNNLFVKFLNFSLTFAFQET